VRGLRAFAQAKRYSVSAGPLPLTSLGQAEGWSLVIEARCRNRLQESEPPSRWCKRQAALSFNSRPTARDKAFEGTSRSGPLRNEGPL
jgi:hypothetical protein